MGKVKFSSSSSFSSRTVNGKTTKKVYKSSFSNGQQNIKIERFDSNANGDRLVDQKKNVKCGYVNKEVAPGQVARVYECSKEEL